MKPKSAYYLVTALPDGTICFASPTRRPHCPKGRRAPVADEDGCHNWSPVGDELDAYTPWGKSVHFGAIVNRLNLKKVLRAQIEPRLTAMEQQLAAIREALARIEQRSVRPEPK